MSRVRLMALAVAVPILLQFTPPEKATPIVRDAFETIEALDEGDRVYMAFDFDPASAGELQPMATAFVRHACEKKLKIYFTALWPVGPQFIKNAERDVISRDFPDMVYGEDFVDLGFCVFSILEKIIAGSDTPMCVHGNFLLSVLKNYFIF